MWAMSMAFSNTPKWLQSNSISSYTGRHSGSSESRHKGGGGGGGGRRQAQGRASELREGTAGTNPAAACDCCWQAPAGWGWEREAAGAHPAQGHRGWVGGRRQAAPWSRRTATQSRPSPPLHQAVVGGTAGHHLELVSSSVRKRLEQAEAAGLGQAPQSPGQESTMGRLGHSPLLAAACRQRTAKCMVSLFMSGKRLAGRQPARGYLCAPAHPAGAPRRPSPSRGMGTPRRSGHSCAPPSPRSGVHPCRLAGRAEDHS